MKNGNGTVPKDNLSVSLHVPVIEKLNKYCLRHDLSNSHVVGKALRRFLAAEMADDPQFWQLYDEMEEK